MSVSVRFWFQDFQNIPVRNPAYRLCTYAFTREFGLFPAPLQILTRIRERADEEETNSPCTPHRSSSLSPHFHTRIRI